MIKHGVTGVKFTLRLASRVPGRERWEAPVILNRPHYAAAVQAELERKFPLLTVVANSMTGRILLQWNRQSNIFLGEAELSEALAVEPLDEEIWLQKRQESKAQGKARKLVSKLSIGGSKLLLILSSSLIWGTVAASPIATPIAVLSVAGTIITGYDFLRALVRTITGQSGITTGTLVGAATLSSLMLRENVTALIVLWLLNLGEYLEILTLRRTRWAIRQLLSTEDDEVWLLRDGLEISVRVSTVQAGDVVVVRAGRRIAVDGAIESGEGFVNEAPITGESMPTARSVNDSVYAGTVLVSGSLRIRVTGVGSETVVGRLIQRVEEAQTLRPKIQTVGDAFARKVVPSSFAAALLVFLVTRDPRRALTMMLVACPCAAGLATPTAISASIGNGARRGILIKGGTHLEAMAQVDTVCFDKTGTLTESHPTVQQVIGCQEGYDEVRLIHLAAQVERYSQHPLATAVLEKAAQVGVAPAMEDNHEFEVLSGRGVRSFGDGEEILAGNADLLHEFGIAINDDALDQSRAWAVTAKTTIFLAHQRQLVGMISIAAKIRPEARESIQHLQSIGINHLMMLTGDTEPVAQAVAQSVGVSEWRSRLLPHDKFDAIRGLRQAGRKVAMVGDGINDAPALALADVGIAMGTAGSDVAIETADVALAADDLRGISSVLQLSRQTLSVVRQNYGLALGTNSIGLYMAAAGSINPIIAAVLHNLSTILVIANSTRLIGYDPTGRRQLIRYPLGATPGTAQCHPTENSDPGCGCHSRTGQANQPELQKQTA